MLPKSNRLTKQMIDDLVKNAHRIKTVHFLVLYKIDESLKNPCISMTISKKYAKSAVTRNTFRRRGYSAVKPLLPLLAPGLLALVALNTGEKKFSVSDMHDELSQAFLKAKLIK